MSFYGTTGATIDHCSFTNNSIVGDNVPGGGGGTLFYSHFGGASVTNTNYSFNTVIGAAAAGAGMYSLGSPNLYMSNCIFLNNSVRQQALTSIHQHDIMYSTSALTFPPPQI